MCVTENNEYSMKMSQCLKLSFLSFLIFKKQPSMFIILVGNRNIHTESKIRRKKKMNAWHVIHNHTADIVLEIVVVVVDGPNMDILQRNRLARKDQTTFNCWHIRMILLHNCSCAQVRQFDIVRCHQHYQDWMLEREPCSWA